MKRILIILALCLCGGVLLAACGESAKPPAASLVKAEHAIANDLQRLEQAEPTPVLLDSADRAIQSNVYTAEADPEKTWYVEELSAYGSVITSFTTRGPVEPAGDELTNPTQKVCSSWGEHNDGGGCVALGLAEPNGVYTHPGGEEHVARLTDGAIYRFSGYYAQSDQPFTVKTPESIQVNASAPISHTNLSKSQGGTLPPRG